jgi:large subunit ribosomal protein L15
MKYNQLQVSANKNKKRVGRGIQLVRVRPLDAVRRARTHVRARSYVLPFRGGQRALVQAVPKARGFKSLRKPAQVVYLDHLNAFKGKTVDNFTLFEEGYIETPFHTVKVIARGELNGKCQFACSSS